MKEKSSILMILLPLKFNPSYDSKPLNLTLFMVVI